MTKKANPPQIARPPAIGKLVQHARVRDLCSRFESRVVKNVLRQLVEAARTQKAARNEDQIADQGRTKLENLLSPPLKKVINATGVIIHTNLGRAPLSRTGLEESANLDGYTNLEYNLETGERGSRHTHLEEIIRVVFGVPAAAVANNNAAAMLLALSGLAKGKEVIVSRGEQIEIGGSFRLPAMIRAAGVKLVEVGTTNKTHWADYREAITKNTRMIMKVHPSNYRVEGFTAGVPVEKLAPLARQAGLTLYYDIGSGALPLVRQAGFLDEPVVGEALEQGADLVSFSCDKLLGGPQAGILAGKPELIAALRRHPLMRAFRVDKVTIMLLHQCLRAYLHADPDLPLWRIIKRTPAELKALAEKLAASLSKIDGVTATVVPSRSSVGGGSLPGETQESYAVSVSVSGLSGQELHRRLRTAATPVVGIYRKGDVLLDMRCVEEEDEKTIEKVSGI
jgi:L-seryl-tRNA(Ser) seleniumtransferase